MNTSNKIRVSLSVCSSHCAPTGCRLARGPADKAAWIFSRICLLLGLVSVAARQPGEKLGWGSVETQTKQCLSDAGMVLTTSRENISEMMPDSVRFNISLEKKTVIVYLNF